MLWLIVAVLLSAALYLAARVRYRQPKEGRETPLLAVGYNPVLGHLKLAIDEQVNSPKAMHAPFGRAYKETKQPIFDVAFGPAWLGQRITFVNDSILAEKILKSKGFGQHPSLLTAVGYSVSDKSLVGMEGESWRRHRKYIQPVFRRDILMQDSLATLIERTRQYADNLTRKIEEGGGSFTLEILPSLGDLMIDITAEILFGYEIKGTHSEERRAVVRDAFGTVMNCIGEIFLSPSLTLWRLFRRRQDRDLTEAKKIITKEVIQPLLRKRRESLKIGEEIPNDVLSLLLKGEQGEATDNLTEDELIGELMGLYIGGFDTTTAAITWTLYMLGELLRGDFISDNFYKRE